MPPNPFLTKVTDVLQIAKTNDHFVVHSILTDQERWCLTTPPPCYLSFTWAQTSYSSLTGSSFLVSIADSLSLLDLLTGVFQGSIFGPLLLICPHFFDNIILSPVFYYHLYTTSLMLTPLSKNHISNFIINSNHIVIWSPWMSNIHFKHYIAHNWTLDRSVPTLCCAPIPPSFLLASPASSPDLRHAIHFTPPVPLTVSAASFAFMRHILP